MGLSDRFNDEPACESADNETEAKSDDDGRSIAGSASAENACHQPKKGAAERRPFAAAIDNKKRQPDVVSRPVRDRTTLADDRQRQLAVNGVARV